MRVPKVPVRGDDPGHKIAPGPIAAHGDAADARRAVDRLAALVITGKEIGVADRAADGNFPKRKIARFPWIDLARGGDDDGIGIVAGDAAGRR